MFWRSNILFSASRNDEDDGAWQFLCGQSHELEQARVVCLGCMIVGDKHLASPADLPLGWCAERTRVGSAWVREQNQTDLSMTKMLANTLVPTRKGEAPLLAAQRGRYVSRDGTAVS
jgi:hypothetical protein